MARRNIYREISVGAIIIAFLVCPLVKSLVSAIFIVSIQFDESRGTPRKVCDDGNFAEELIFQVLKSIDDGELCA